MRRGSLPTGDRDALAAPLAALNDRAQPAHRLHVLASQPPARPERLQQAIGQRGGLGLERVPHADVKAISSRITPGTLAPQFKSTYSPALIAAFAFDWSAK